MATSTLLCAVAILLALSPIARGLSWPLCNTYGSEWVSASPHLDGGFPYTSLIFFCEGGLNIEGFAIDACVRNGTDCGQEAADLFCQYLGYEANSPGLFTVVPAAGPALSLTGEWCLTEGRYEELAPSLYENITQFAALNATLASGPACSSLASVTCYRTRTTLSGIWDSLPARATAAAAPGPSMAASPASATLLPATSAAETPSYSSQSYAGRRLLLTGT